MTYVNLSTLRRWTFGAGLFAAILTACSAQVHSVGTDGQGSQHDSTCAGDTPTCCGTNAEGCSGPFGTATCEAGSWTCADGSAPGGACPSICPPEDAGPDAHSTEDAGPDAHSTCSGKAPTCCGTNAEGCSGPYGVATCSAGTWTCPAGEGEPGGTCPTICPPPNDAGPDTNPVNCAGSNPPVCCGVNAQGCTGPYESALCEQGTWVCPDPQPPVCELRCPSDAAAD